MSSGGDGTGFLNRQDLDFDSDPPINLTTAHDQLRNPRTDELILILEREVITDVALSSSMSVISEGAATRMGGPQYPVPELT